MPSRFYVIPVSDNGRLTDDLRICDTKAAALETAMQSLSRHAGLVVAEEHQPFEELELVRVIGRVQNEVVESLVA